jgi:hypothetical protein
VPLLDLVPRSFGDYEAAGGGRGLQTALAAWPVAVIQEVARSGLRGRGGAGFPTGEKWRAVRAVGAGPRYAVCNAAEGEPATFKDRLLLRTNPYQVLEGLAIAAYAVGAERAYIGLKETFTVELQALTRALGEMQDADALGPVPVELVLGPDLYLFGEETGLEEVIEGRPPLPRVARPFIQGLFAQPPADNPTLVNNVETLANVPHILADGPDWLRANGTEAAPGTMVFTICGDVRHEGVFELPLGSPLRYLVEELAGGPPDGRAVKAIFRPHRPAHDPGHRPRGAAHLRGVRPRRPGVSGHEPEMAGGVAGECSMVRRTSKTRWDLSGQAVFRTERGTPVSPNHASRAFARLAASVGLVAHPHLLRHALASAMAANKGPASIIAAQLRHADGGRLAQRVYIHQLPQTAPRLAGVIEGVFGPAARDGRAVSTKCRRREARETQPRGHA